jgi:histidinol-phosphate aminotransferase
MTTMRPIARLHMNEQSADLDEVMKYDVLHQLIKTPWNRYPAATFGKLEQQVAEYCGLEAEQIALGPGSAAIIANMLNYFAIQRMDITIVQPTYSLFDHHCRCYGIAYTPWKLNADLEFDYENIPELNANSVLIITSPNNPVGNTICEDRLSELLERFPDTLIILDNVYYEFSDTDFAPLLAKYSNLLILRSFSKAFPVAGLRLGYACTSAERAAWLRKISLTFSINHLTLAMAEELLFTPAFQQEAAARVSEIMMRRDDMIQTLRSNFNHALEVFNSAGNFILVRIKTPESHSEILESFQHAGILVLDATGFPGLQQCIRISIGNEAECQRVIQTLQQVLHVDSGSYSSSMHALALAI